MSNQRKGEAECCSAFFDWKSHAKAWRDDDTFCRCAMWNVGLQYSCFIIQLSKKHVAIILLMTPAIAPLETSYVGIHLLMENNHYELQRVSEHESHCC